MILYNSSNYFDPMFMVMFWGLDKHLLVKIAALVWFKALEGDKIVIVCKRFSLGFLSFLPIPNQSKLHVNTI